MSNLCNKVWQYSVLLSELSLIYSVFLQSVFSGWSETDQNQHTAFEELKCFLQNRMLCNKWNELLLWNSSWNRTCKPICNNWCETDMSLFTLSEYMLLIHVGQKLCRVLCNVVINVLKSTFSVHWDLLCVSINTWPLFSRWVSCSLWCLMI